MKKPLFVDGRAKSVRTLEQYEKPWFVGIHREVVSEV